MRELGPIRRLQVQRSSLKTGEKPDRVYDPTPLLPVERLAVTPDGVLGAGGSGGAGSAEAWIVDVHHRAHPATKNEDGMHGVSVGFTSHYAAMRERFGKRITVGCAGENIIADTGRLVALEELQDGDGGGGGGGGGVLTVVGRDGTEKVRLRVLQVAHPCRPFTGFALGSRVDAEVLKSHLQFLDGGMRGFYCVAEGTGVVEVGDLLLLA